jgi:hypothetical protein
MKRSRFECSFRWSAWKVAFLHVNKSNVFLPKKNHFDWSADQPIKSMLRADFRKSLHWEKEDEVKQFLMKYDINKPEDELGCVRGTLCSSF